MAPDNFVRLMFDSFHSVTKIIFHIGFLCQEPIFFHFFLHPPNIFSPEKATAMPRTLHSKKVRHKLLKELKCSKAEWREKKRKMCRFGSFQGARLWLLTISNKWQLFYFTENHSDSDKIQYVHYNKFTVLCFGFKFSLHLEFNVYVFLCGLYITQELKSQSQTSCEHVAWRRWRVAEKKISRQVNIFSSATGLSLFCVGLFCWG